MLGDFLREVAVLVIVFYPLDTYIDSLHEGARVGEMLSRGRVIALSLALLVAGMALEKLDFGRLGIGILDSVLGILTTWRIRLGREGR
jgi:hypothetical protein